jgi:hypothetical protein
MDNGLYSFRKIEINHSFLDTIWKFNPMTLGSLDDLTVSKYSIALAQYLIFFKSELNQTKASIVKKKKFLDTSVSIAMTDKLIKQYKTKVATTEYLITTLPELSKLSEEISELQSEVTHLDGVDKSISEYIATFKRELGRREKEIFAIRAERRM